MDMKLKVLTSEFDVKCVASLYMRANVKFDIYQTVDEVVNWR